MAEDRALVYGPLRIPAISVSAEGDSVPELLYRRGATHPPDATVRSSSLATWRPSCSVPVTNLAPR